MDYCQYPSPVGTLYLTADEAGLTGIWMHRSATEASPFLKQAAQWLDAYFAGNPQPPAFLLNPKGTAFQKQVWQLLLDIPYGQTRTYGEIAREMALLTGKEKMSAQAVGQAVGKNPISILIPCHRVVGANGKLTGYAGGLDKKQWLLRHEGWLQDRKEQK
ncbi:MAG: methylated-DNA--[protein]-cysteine S-methyltransferase [Faecousia sp.]